MTLPGVYRAKGTLLQIIQDTQAYTGPKHVEVRVGLVFYGEEGTRIAAVFFDEDCRNALVNNEPAVLRTGSLDGGLCSWAKSSLKGVGIY